MLPAFEYMASSLPRSFYHLCKWRQTYSGAPKLFRQFERGAAKREISPIIGNASRRLIIGITFLIFVFNSFSQSPVPQATMQKIYDEVKTPYKYGLVVLPPDTTKKVDCPTIYKFGKTWYMTYLVFDGRGYETWLASSKDLLNWKTLGVQLAFSNKGWDANQKAGYNALVDTKWGGKYKLKKYNGKYWMSYFGGSSAGYEVEPLSIGMAYTTKKPTTAFQWNRLPQPVLASYDEDVHWWENRNKLFKSYVIEDKVGKNGHKFIMYYNAVGDSLKDNEKTRWYERIGMAVSNDMLFWKRFKYDPVVHHPVGITGDPMIQKINDVWVMFYFGAFWQEQAKRLNACFLVYHYYCAVDAKDNRAIAVATSVDKGKSNINFK